MANKPRRHHTPEQKVALIKSHLCDQVPISRLCDDNDLCPSLFYRWLKIFFENGAAAFEAQVDNPQNKRLQKRIDQLESKLSKKNDIIVEVDGKRSRMSDCEFLAWLIQEKGKGARVRLKYLRGRRLNQATLSLP